MHIFSKRMQRLFLSLYNDKMNFIQLQQKIEDASKKAFLEMYEQHGEEEIYAFALYSDEGAMTVCPSTNTVRFLEQNEDEDDRLYYKYEPAEWRYEMQGANQEFNAISKALYDEVMKISDDEEAFTQFRENVFAVCIDVLEKLKNEDFFSQITGKDVFLIFSVSDDVFSAGELESIINRLNDNAYKAEYLDWMKTWGN